MSAERITDNLVDAYQLLDLSERLLDELESAPLNELPRLLQFLKKNIRDAKHLISDAEMEFDALIREIDEAEEKAVLMEVMENEAL